MTKLTLDTSIPLAGLIAASNRGVEGTRGEGRQRLREWLLGLASRRDRAGSGSRPGSGGARPAPEREGRR
jgi:hypothetical protein